MPDRPRTRIALYGDSLSLPRPGVVVNGQRYIMRLHDRLEERLGMVVDVLDRGEGGGSISMLKGRVIHDKGYYKEPGFLAVMQSGIVDCAPRPVDESTRVRISRLPSFIRKRVIKYLHNNRTRLLLRRFYVRTSPSLFLSEYQEALKWLKVHYEHLFCINICPAPASYEKVSPGVTRQIAAYNELVREAAASAGARLVDVHSMIQDGGDIYEYIVREDDHHIMPRTHEWIADDILTQLGTETLPSTHPSRA
ncbi:MAG: hypothetical protein CJBNEKGG_00292 [Prosthecobacter sp.]|nr:hypothetical protein [Prosthecobacter sp.]